MRSVDQIIEKLYKLVKKKTDYLIFNSLIWLILSGNLFILIIVPN